MLKIFSGKKAYLSMYRYGFCIILLAVLVGVISCSTSVPHEQIIVQTVVVEKIVTVEVPVMVEEMTQFTATSVVPPSATPRSNTNFTGYYVVERDQERFPDAGCAITVIHENSLNLFDLLQFELSCSVGAPSYNRGYATDTILFESESLKQAVYSSPHGECHLIFEFLDTGDLEITQLGLPFDCGFGNAVFANGVYELRNTAVSPIGCLHPDQRPSECNE